MAPSILHAKQRSSRRRGSAGAAMFVVAMTMAVLVSVGVYALAASANETRTAGNERQSTQTHYLADYGIVGAAHELNSTRAQFLLGQMLNATYRDTLCVSLPTPPTTYQTYPQMLACKRLGSAELGSTWNGGATITVNYSGTTPYASSATPGSLGPMPMTADFFVELTEPTQANAPARYALDLQFCFIEMTVSSTGLTYPVVTGASASTDQFGAEGTETERARILAGPVRCPK
jgi:hypothetical protein